MMTERDLDKSGSPRPSRRRTWWTLLVFAAAFIAVLAVLIYCDAEPPDVSDLKIAYVKIPEAENFYLALATRGRAFGATPLIVADLPDDSAETLNGSASSGGAGSPARTLYNRLLDGEAWTPERIAKWGNSLDELVLECGKISNLDKMQGPDPCDGMEKDPVTSWAAFALLNHLRFAAWAQYHAGRQENAVETALLGLKIGRRLADAQSIMSDYSFALTVQERFLELLQDLAARPEIHPERLREILDALNSIEVGKDAYLSSLKNNALWTMNLIHAMSAEQAAGIRRMPNVFVFTAKTRVLFPLIYKPNLTAALYAEHIRECIRIHDLPMAVRKSRRSPPLGGELDFPTLLRPYNSLGRWCLSTLHAQAEFNDVARHATFSRQGLVQAFVALRLYHMDHGVLPATLDDLVPAYLPAVPMDYVDRKPLRYSREFRSLWSVGQKGLTVGSANQSVEETEVFCRLDFAAPLVAPAP